MSFNLKIWRYRYGLTQQQAAWLLGLSVAGIRRLDAGIEQLELGDVAWLQDYARIRDQAREVPEVQVRVGRWHFLVAQSAGTVRPADKAAARALRGAGRRRLERSAVEFTLNFSHTQPGIGWLWLHADGRPTRRNPAFAPCWRVDRPAHAGTWSGWPACANVEHFCGSTNWPPSDYCISSVRLETS
jgi:hypothetical protein